MNKYFFFLPLLVLSFVMVACNNDSDSDSDSDSDKRMIVGNWKGSVSNGIETVSVSIQFKSNGKVIHSLFGSWIYELDEEEETITILSATNENEIKAVYSYKLKSNGTKLTLTNDDEKYSLTKQLEDDDEEKEYDDDSPASANIIGTWDNESDSIRTVIIFKTNTFILRQYKNDKLVDELTGSYTYKNEYLNFIYEDEDEEEILHVISLTADRLILENEEGETAILYRNK